MTFPPLRRFAIGAVLLFAMLALAVPARADDALTPAQKNAVDQAIHDYLVNHPEVVLESLKAGQQKSDMQAAAQAQQMIAVKRKELLENKDDLVQGNPKGDVTLVEFFDYRCPYCKQIEPSLDALLKEDPKLRIVYKEFPVLGEPSTYATRVAFAARKQNKYADFHRAMMATKGDITDDIVLKVAASVGLNLDKIKTDMGSAEIDTLINANYALAETLNIDGTPALVIGNTMIPGAIDLDTLRKDIATARKGG